MGYLRTINKSTGSCNQQLSNKIRIPTFVTTPCLIILATQFLKVFDPSFNVQIKLLNMYQFLFVAIVEVKLDGKRYVKLVRLLPNSDHPMVCAVSHWPLNIQPWFNSRKVNMGFVVDKVTLARTICEI